VPGFRLPQAVHLLRQESACDLNYLDGVFGARHLCQRETSCVGPRAARGRLLHVRSTIGLHDRPAEKGATTGYGFGWEIEAPTWSRIGRMAGFTSYLRRESEKQTCSWCSPIRRRSHASMRSVQKSRIDGGF